MLSLSKQSQSVLPSPPVMGSTTISVSVADLARAFAEWDRRYREEPARFMSEVEHLLKETPQTYGDICAVYFSKLIAETRLG